MKNLLFGIIATLLVYTNGYSQIKSLTEKDRLTTANTMLSFVNSIKIKYTANETFGSFSKKVCDTKSISTDGINIVHKAYNYIRTKSTDEYIQKNENGEELISAYNNFKLSKTSQPFEIYLLGQTNNVEFWGFWAWLKQAFEWMACCADGVFCCTGN